MIADLNGSIYAYYVLDLQANGDVFVCTSAPAPFKKLMIERLMIEIVGL